MSNVWGVFVAAVPVSCHDSHPVHSDFGSNNSIVTVVSDSAKPQATSQPDDPMSDDEQVRPKKFFQNIFETFF